MISGVGLFIIAFSMVLLFAVWLEYRNPVNPSKIRKNTNPYELIDFQKEIREQREKENG